MRIEETTMLTADPESVHELMTSKRFQDAKAEALGAVRFESSVTATGEEVTVVTRRVMTPASVPELIKAMVEPTITVTEQEVWRATAAGFAGSFSVRVSGAPIQVDGAVALEPGRDGGTRLTFAGELSTSVPLFKSAIERAAATQVVGTITEEFKLLHDWPPRAATQGKVD